MTDDRKSDRYRRGIDGELSAGRLDCVTFVGPMKRICWRHTGGAMMPLAGLLLLSILLP